MCVLLFDFFKHLVLRKTDVLKTCRKSISLGKEMSRNAIVLKSKKVRGILGKISLWDYYLQLSFVYKNVSQISFDLFCSGGKKFFIRAP